MSVNKNSKVNKILATLSRPNVKGKVALSLVDQISYEFEALQDEVGRISYSVNEFFDEEFDKFYNSRSNLLAVYRDNSEAFITEADVAGDREILLQIKDLAEQIGMIPEDVYPSWQEHLDLLDELEDLEARFDEQRQELRDFGVI